MTFNPVRARVGISLFFFTNGAMFSGLLPRYPEVKDAFALTNTGFGLMVAIMPLAAMAASALPAPIIRRFGTTNVSLWGSVILAVMISVAGWAPNLLLFGVAMAVYGFLDATVDAAQNVHGVRVEDAYGRTIINSLHALWSLGAALGGVVGAWAAAAGIPLGVHLTASAVVVLALAVLATWLARLPNEAAPAATEEEAPPTKLPPGALRLIGPLVVLAIAGGLIEDVAFNWSALHLRQSVGASLGVAGLGASVVLGAQTIGRLLGDPATDRWGAVSVIRAGGVMILLGGLLVVFSPVASAVMVGYALCGYGCATIVPTAYAAAGRLPGLPEGSGITYISWLMRVAFLLTSPIVGAVSDLTSLRVALGILVLSGLAIVLLAPVVRPVDRASA